jgi:hypothetical protein
MIFSMTIRRYQFIYYCLAFLIVPVKPAFQGQIAIVYGVYKQPAVRYAQNRQDFYK